MLLVRHTRSSAIIERQLFPGLNGPLAFATARAMVHVHLARWAPLRVSKYGSRHSAPAYFPLEHIVFSDPLASEKFPRILGGKEGFKNRTVPRRQAPTKQKLFQLVEVRNS